MLSILSLADKRNYIVTDSAELREYFTNLLSLQSHGDALATDHLILRKEIMKLW